MLNRISIFFSVLALASCFDIKFEDGYKFKEDAFCATGIPAPVLPDDEVVGVRFIEAPLLSIQYGPLPGDIMHAYHSALLLETATTNYTLEYDAENGMGSSSIPIIDATNLAIKWKNAAGYCLTEGLLHGLKHWSVQFTEIATLTGAEFNSLFGQNGFIQQNNKSAEYDLMRVIGKNNNVLLKDNTCGDGVKRILYYLRDAQNITFSPATSKIQTSSFTLHAESIELVNATDLTTWNDTVKFYEEVVDMVAKGESISKRFKDALGIIRGHGYVYSQGKYYRLKGMHFPYITIARVPIFENGKTEEGTVHSFFNEMGDFL